MQVEVGLFQFQYLSANGHFHTPYLMTLGLSDTNTEVGLKWSITPSTVISKLF